MSLMTSSPSPSKSGSSIWKKNPPATPLSKCLSTIKPNKHLYHFFYIQIKPGTNNPIFDEQFFFEFPEMTVEQLDRAKILFNVYDTKFWGKSDSLIGSF